MHDIMIVYCIYGCLVKNILKTAKKAETVNRHSQPQPHIALTPYIIIIIIIFMEFYKKRWTHIGDKSK